MSNFSGHFPRGETEVKVETVTPFIKALWIDNGKCEKSHQVARHFEKCE